ncbi:primase C-terminal domain-containing protein (plasmid) [Lactiplantibacillus plantarum]|uniref:primase C-terminal domain-containing protein n=2 Tax=Lactiplantibacillus plantarum TaxID=1590 RepID=UPI002230D6F9|nr:primase C-terminal domain-containing protein [Lactiplantibacillus plantarum]MCG0714427.1 plasmid replication protein [Lactiplantibacillus plantarum]UZD35056.1 primase C-terminal domain-containing protein [Lactiplantibacillus plantarum]WHQ52944.1 primase C-terminal domain-containing protein [Lactiplantibacillus plantarum]
MSAMEIAQQAIDLILHQGLRETKAQHSNVLKLEKTIPGKQNKHGAIAMYRSKAQMAKSWGTIYTSKEAVYDNYATSTHWTPNVFNYLTYTDAAKHYVKGAKEQNLSQINTLVVDVDYRDAEERQAKFAEVWDTAMLDVQFMPTLILATQKGYHIYYVFDEPVFVRRHANGKLPAVRAAKAIAKSLKDFYAQKLPAVDVTCNSFGIFRVPRPDNIEYFEPKMTVDFQALMTWSINFANDQHQIKPQNTQRSFYARRVGRQIDQPWFQALINQTDIDQNVGYGRHNTIFTLALACYSSNVSQAQCFDILDEFNSNLNHPLATQHVQKVINDAYSGQFHAASREYVNALLETWVPDADRRVYLQRSQTTWYKYAKPRTERVNSHVQEWQADLMAYFNQRTSQDNNWFTRTSLRHISKELNICLGSLTKALKKLIDQGLVYREKGHGRQATMFATRSSLLQHAMALKQAQRLNYWLMVARFLDPTEQLLAVQRFSLTSDPNTTEFEQLRLVDTG